MEERYVRELLRRVPFEPFTVQVSDGRKVFIHHPDYLLVAPGGKTLFAFDPDGTFHLLNNAQVTGLRGHPASSP